MSEPRVLSRAEHPVSRRNILPEALHVLQRLHKLGFKSYLVGGAVRDLYLGRQPKDFDVGTDAKPSRLKKVFRHCRIIGRRFRIAHVHFPGDRIIEVATFRRNSPNIIRSQSGVIVSDNEFGTPQQDALRRDLTINGLFYDIATFSIIDYVGGIDDLSHGVIRTISDPDQSFREDPVRMIRAIRHGARTGFRVEDKTLEAIYRNAADISLANPARLLEELSKDLRSGAARPFFRATLETHVLDSLCPDLSRQLRDTGPDHPFWGRMEALDRWSTRGEACSTAVLLGLFLQTILFPDPDHWSVRDQYPVDVWRHVAKGFREIHRGFRISRRDAERLSQILVGVRKLQHGWQHGRIPRSIRSKAYLPEALDFFLIDLEAAGEDTQLVESWRQQYGTPAAHEASRGDGTGEEREDPPGNAPQSGRSVRRRRGGSRGRRGRRTRRPPTEG